METGIERSKGGSGGNEARVNVVWIREARINETWVLRTIRGRDVGDGPEDNETETRRGRDERETGSSCERGVDYGCEGWKT